DRATMRVGNLFQGYGLVAGPHGLRADHRDVTGSPGPSALIPGTAEDAGHLPGEAGVVRAVPGLIEAVGVIEFLVPQERQDQHTPAVRRPAVLPFDVSRWKGMEALVILNESQAKLPEIVPAGLLRCCRVRVPVDPGNGHTHEAEKKERHQVADADSRHGLAT